MEDFTATILDLIEHPRHGFGAGLNPCIDCHTAMIRRAGELMRERGFQFIATGEVLNQRPMSQHRQAQRGPGERPAQHHGVRPELGGDIGLGPPARGFRRWRRSEPAG